MKLVKANDFEMKNLYQMYFFELIDGVNGYLERRILESQSFLIVDEQVVGICSIDEENWLTGFYIRKEFHEKYETYFNLVMTLKKIKNIYMTSKDAKLFKVVQKRDYFSEIHSYNFKYENPFPIDFKMELVPQEETDKLLSVFSDFLEYNDVDLNHIDLYLHSIGEEMIALGFYIPFKIINRACVAMIVNPEYRNQGYGVKTLQFLGNLLDAKGIPINARCWVKNELSKATLLRAGYEITSETLKITMKE